MRLADHSIDPSPDTSALPLTMLSPAGVFSITSHLPPNPTPLATVVVRVVVVVVVVVVAFDVVVVVPERFALHSPSANPPKSALPAIVAPSTLPVSVIGSELPWKL